MRAGDVVMGVTAYPFLAPFPARIYEVQRGICKFNALLQAPCDRLCRRRDDDAALFRQKVRYGKIEFARVVVEAEHPASRWEFRQFLGNGRKSRARRNANQRSFFVCRKDRQGGGQGTSVAER